MLDQPKLKPSTDADWRKYYEDKCRAQFKELMRLRATLNEVQLETATRESVLKAELGGMTERYTDAQMQAHRLLSCLINIKAYAGRKRELGERFEQRLKLISEACELAILGKWTDTEAQ